MSFRFASTQLIPGAFYFGAIRGLGVLGSAIPSTGDDGPGYAYNDLSLPADATKEILAVVTTPPSGPNVTSFFAYEDTSFDLRVTADGTYSWQYTLYEDGVSKGTGTANVIIGTGNPTQLSGTINVGATTSGTLTTAPELGGTVNARATTAGALTTTATLSGTAYANCGVTGQLYTVPPTIPNAPRIALAA